jgi:hypothetical protein
MPISKEAKAAYDRARRAAKRDQLLEYQAVRRRARTPEERAKYNAYMHAYRKNHSERLRAQARERTRTGYYREWNRRKRDENPTEWRRRQRDIRLKSKYGITGDEYDAMAAAQAGVCAICGRAETMRIKGTLCILAVDHDAATGRVRGLLCVNCNMLIGGAKDDPAILREAIAYLER